MMNADISVTLPVSSTGASNVSEPPLTLSILYSTHYQTVISNSSALLFSWMTTQLHTVTAQTASEGSLHVVGTSMLVLIILMIVAVALSGYVYYITKKRKNSCEIEEGDTPESPSILNGVSNDTAPIIRRSSLKSRCLQPRYLPSETDDVWKNQKLRRLSEKKSHLGPKSALLLTEPTVRTIFPTSAKLWQYKVRELIVEMEERGSSSAGRKSRGSSEIQQMCIRAEQSSDPTQERSRKATLGTLVMELLTKIRRKSRVLPFVRSAPALHPHLGTVAEEAPRNPSQYLAIPGEKSSSFKSDKQRSRSSPNAEYSCKTADKV